MELLRYLKVVQKNKWIILLLLALGLSVTTFYTVNQPPQYDSRATMVLTTSVDNNPYLQNQVAASLADGYTELIHTRSFADEVRKELPFPLTADQVSNSLTTRLRSDTLFYDITGRMNTPERAQQLVSTTLKVFLLRANAQQGKDTTRDEIRSRLITTLDSLSEQVKIYNSRISSLEAQPATKDRDDLLLQLRGQLLTLQQTQNQTLLTMAQLGNRDPDAFRVVDQPLLGKLASNKLFTNMLLALVVSLLLGVGLAFLRDYLDYSINSFDQAETALGVAPVAAIGMMSAGGYGYGYGYGYGSGKRKRGRFYDRLRPGPKGNRMRGSSMGKPINSKLVTLEHSKSPESENFRALRTNIQFSSMDKPIRSLVVTSSAPGEGKSFTASNLAVVMAQAGKRVILVDADLRKPTQHKIFELPNMVGFSNLVLNGTTQVEGAIQHVPGVSDLAVITSGPMPPNPSELLNSHQALQVMSQLAQQADMVIYDAPPAGAVTDPVILATRTDAVILVISAGVTRKDAATRVRQNLQKVGITSVLPVLNRVNARDMQGYYYYRYYSDDTQPTVENGRDGHSNGNGKASELLETEVSEEYTGVGRGKSSRLKDK